MPTPSRCAVGWIRAAALAAILGWLLPSAAAATDFSKYHNYQELSGCDHREGPDDACDAGQRPDGDVAGHFCGGNEEDYRQNALTPFSNFPVNEEAASSGQGERRSHVRALRRPHNPSVNRTA